jgi:hypothetical protein
MLNTTQKLGKVTLERLRGHGKMGDSFDSVVNRLLDEVEDDDSEEVDEDEI